MSETCFKFHDSAPVSTYSINESRGHEVFFFITDAACQYTTYLYYRRVNITGLADIWYWDWRTLIVLSLCLRLIVNVLDWESTCDKEPVCVLNTVLSIGTSVVHWLCTRFSSFPMSQSARLRNEEKTSFKQNINVLGITIKTKKHIICTITYAFSRANISKHGKNDVQRTIVSIQVLLRLCCSSTTTRQHHHTMHTWLASSPTARCGHH